MKGYPRQINDPSQGEYLRSEGRAEDALPGSGLLADTNNPSASALESALQTRRQKLSEKKIGLYPTPGESDIQ